MTAARAALDYGFTTIRDPETEGAMYGDVKTAIERGVIPGPRMQVATRASARDLRAQSDGGASRTITRAPTLISCHPVARTVARR